MSRYLLLLTGLIVVLVSPTLAEPPYEIGRPFELAVGQTATFGRDGLEVGFKGVPSDSRCPADVMCVWEGDAHVQIWAHDPDRAQTDLDLHTFRGYEREASFGPYVIRLLQVVPYPRTDTELDPDDYTVTLVVFKATDDMCGELVPGAECVLFQQDFGGIYVLANYAGFQVGDRVRVNGSLTRDCITVCMQGDGCIQENTIEACSPTPIIPVTWGRIKVKYGD